MFRQKKKIATPDGEADWRGPGRSVVARRCNSPDGKGAELDMCNHQRSEVRRVEGFCFADHAGDDGDDGGVRRSGRRDLQEQADAALAPGEK